MTRYPSRRPPVSRSTPNAGWTGLLLTGFLGLGTCWGLWQWIDRNPQNWQSLQRQASSLSSTVQQAASPKTVIFTKRVANPLPGHPNAFNASQGKTLDQKAQQIEYLGTSVEELARRIAAVAQSEGERARLAYSWITQNIAYDVAMAETRNIDDLRPETVLARRRTICSGYANLYQALGTALGLEVVIIEGFAKGGDFVVGDDPNANHAWNGVKIGEGWHLVDPTWGAGTVNQGKFTFKFNPHYFATPPNQLIVTHFPRETQWQLLSQPYDRQRFDALPALTPRFFRDGLGLGSFTQRQITAQGQVAVTLTVPSDVQVVGRIQTQTGQKLEDYYTLSNRGQGTVTLQAAFPTPGEYELIILSKKGNEEMYHQALSYDITAQSAGQPFPRTYSTFHERKARLMAPLGRSLPVNHTSAFQLQVPGAEEVVLVNPYTREFKPLTRSGDLFIGSERITSPRVVVAARFPGTNKYWSLVEYE